MPEGSRATDASRGRFMGRYLAAEELDRVESLIPLAQDLDMTLAQRALAWCLRDSGISSLIVGATKPEQLDENCGASGIRVPEDVIEKINQTFRVTLDDNP